jgi:sialic acid synthase SpsE
MSMRIEIIAELHPQHGGNLGTIREMIRVAALNGADVAKFQLYDAPALLGSDKWNYLQLDQPTTARIKQWCDQDGIEFAASVFDEVRFRWCEELGVRRYKIASRTVSQDPALCRRILDTGKPTVISLGMWTGSQLPFGSTQQISYLHCKSAYPAFLEDMRDFPVDFRRAGLAGYSDHTLGLGACYLAIARGAHIIEKHLTLSKTLTKETEKAHICSMTPEELLELRRVGGEIARTARALAPA